MPRAIPESTRELCLSLPDTEEVSRHGAPNFKVKGKTFAMFVLNHHGDGRVALWLNSPHGAQQMYTQLDPESYFVPPYVGVKGWLGMELNKNLEWNQIYTRVREAYEHASQSSPDIPASDDPPVAPPDVEMLPEDINPWLGKQAQEILATMHQHCLRLPETSRDESGGHTTWKGGKKAYAGVAHDKGRLQLRFKIGIEQQAFLVADPRYTIPLYYGTNGWINLDVQNGVNWEEVDSLLESSYRRIALKRMLKALRGSGC